NDWGGISPLTMDYVNPEAPWPQLRFLEAATRATGSQLVARLCVYPEYVRDFDTAQRWLDPAVLRHVLAATDGEGLVRTAHWWPADRLAPPTTYTPSPIRPAIDAALDRAERGERLEEREVEPLLTARGDEVRAIARLADDVRREVSGDVVTYVITRNINYTNICSFKCQFCAFSKGKMSENLRGKPYDLEMSEVGRRVIEAWDRGASEVCMQGGIHPSYTGQKYLEVCRTVKAAVPEVHLHAFSPLEIHQGARTLGIPVAAFLQQLKAAGLGTLPGTAAEILDDEVRETLCADKIRTQQWLDVMRTAHSVGFKSTA